MFDKNLKLKIEKLFDQLGLETVLLHVTSSGISNKKLFANNLIKKYLKDSNFHDFDKQKNGLENKKIVSTKVIIGDKIINSEITFIKPNDGSKSSNFWIKELQSYIKVDDLLALLVKDQSFFIIHCNKFDMHTLRTFNFDLIENKRPRAASWNDYNYANDILNNLLFKGLYENQDIYLDIEGDLASHFAEKLSETVESLNDRIFDIVSSQLKFGQTNPLISFVEKNHNWKKKNYEGFPPSTLFLCSLSLGAEKMRAGDRYSLNNYYDRLIEAFKVSGSADQKSIRNSFGCTIELWRDLNRWLIRNDGKFGVATAKPIMPSKKYISYPISQALIREGDREKIRSFLEDQGFSSNEEEGNDVIAEVLGRWFRSSSPTKYLKSLWDLRSIRSVIIASAVSELQNIPDKFGKDLDGNNCKYKAFLKLHFKLRKYPKEKLLISWTSNYKDRFVDEIQVYENTPTSIFDDDKAIYLSPIDKDTAVLGPTNNINLEYLLKRGTKLTNVDKSISFSYLPRHATALEKADDGFYYEVNHPKLFVEHMILLEKKEKANIENFLKQYANDEYIFKENLDGLPDAYICIDNVRFIKSVSIENRDKNDDIKYWLFPTEIQTSLEIAGGLRLSRNIFHNKSKLTLIFQSNDEAKIRVIGVPTSQKNTDVLTIDKSFLVKAENGICCLELGSLNDDSVDRDFEIFSDKKGLFSDVNISFRSANSPRQTVFSEYELKSHALNAHSFVSCIPCKIEGRDDAYNINISDIKSASTKHKNIINSHYFVGDFYLEDDTYDNEDYVYSNHAVTTGEESCIEKGHHIWVVPETLKNGKWDCQCKICNERRLILSYRNHQKKNQEQIKLKPIFERPVRRMPIENILYDLDTLFDAICYFKSLSWDIFKRLCEYAEVPNLFAINLIRQLSALGHVNIELDSNKMKLKKCHVVSPKLVEIEGKFLLTGFRNSQMITYLTEHIGMPLIKKGVPITQYIFETIPDNFNTISEGFGMKIEVIKKVNTTKKLNIADLSLAYNSLPPISLSNKSKFEKFDPQKCRWIEVDTLNERGGYRIQWPITIYFLRLNNGATVSSTAPIAKIYAADIKGFRLHNYNSENSTFISKIGCDLPPLVERTLVSYSGELPIETKEGNLIYSNIPPEIGNLTIENHYGTNL